jgi:hypothetical protein
MRSKVISTLFALLVCFGASAKENYLADAVTQYPSIAGTPLNSCSLCHTAPPVLNSYGSDWKAANRSFAAIESEDSDNDTFSNITEIEAGTFPGSAASVPASIRVKKPNGGETWVQSSKATVAWSTQGLAGSDVQIELLQNGVKVKTLKASVPNDGKQKVKVPSTVGTDSNFRVRVVSTSHATVSDVSNNPFSIVSP